MEVQKVGIGKLEFQIVRVRIMGVASALRLASALCFMGRPNVLERQQCQIQPSGTLDHMAYEISEVYLL